MVCLLELRQCRSTGGAGELQSAGVALAGMVPDTAAELLPNGPVILMVLVPAATVATSSSTTSSAWSMADPPLLASVTVAVTVTGTVPSAGPGGTATAVEAGPTESVLGGGAFVSRKVSMPPKATDVGSTPADWPPLSSWAADSKSASFASGPEGIVTSESIVTPGSTAATTEGSGEPRACASCDSSCCSPPSRLIGCSCVPALT